MLSQAIAKHLKASPEWQALAAHIEVELHSLTLTAGIDFTDKEAAAIEGRARQLAEEKLKKILEPFYMQVQDPVDVGKVVSARAGL